VLISCCNIIVFIVNACLAASWTSVSC